MYSFHAALITMIYLADLILFVPIYTRSKFDGSKRKKKLLWKGACVGLPFLVLVIETILAGFSKELTISNYILILAMLLCGLGDIVLEIKFVMGGILFFFGHVGYIISMILLTEKMNPSVFLVFALMIAIGTLLTVSKLSKKYRFYLIVYNIAISGSFAFSLPLIMTGNPALVLLGLGACFLMISDWLLARNKKYGNTFGWSLISLLFYFGGQVLISAYPFLM